MAFPIGGHAVGSGHGCGHAAGTGAGGGDQPAGVVHRAAVGQPRCFSDTGGHGQPCGDANHRTYGQPYERANHGTYGQCKGYADARTIDNAGRFTGADVGTIVIP